MAKAFNDHEHQIILTSSPGSPGSPGSPLIFGGWVGTTTVVQINVHPSVQHFCDPGQSVSNKHPFNSAVTGGHSFFASASTTGHSPGFPAIRIRK